MLVWVLAGRVGTGVGTGEGCGPVVQPDSAARVGCMERFLLETRQFERVGAEFPIGAEGVRLEALVVCDEHRSSAEEGDDIAPSVVSGLHLCIARWGWRMVSGKG